MAEPLIVDGRITIPAEELRFSFARSSGPGGQNVNKLNTKARLHWSLATSAALPASVLERFRARYANRLNDAGEFVLTSERYREQARNVRDCRDKLRAMILSVAAAPIRRKPTRPSRRAVEARLQAKRRQAEKKRSRRLRPDD